MRVTLFLALCLLPGSATNCSVSVPVGFSLTAARDAARALKVSSRCSLVTVKLAPGVHTLSTSLQLGLPDSHIHWDGFGGLATISGGVSLSGWRKFAANSALVVTEWPQHASLRELYVNGSRCLWTRLAANATGLTAAEGAMMSAAGFVTPSRLPLSWPSPEGVELLHNSKFQQSRCPVTAVEELANRSVRVLIAQPCWGLGRKLGQMGFPSAVLNIGPTVGSTPALLPGTWWLDRRRKPPVVLYAPRSDAERKSLLRGSVLAEAPGISAAIIATGVDDLVLNGIVFERFAYDEPSSGDGYLERYGGVRFLRCDSDAGRDTGSCFAGEEACAAGCCGAQTIGGCALAMSPAAVRIRGGTSMAVVGCTFRGLAGWGLGISHGAQDVTVAYNRFSDCGGGGLFLGNVNETRTRTRPHPSHLTVADNHFENLGQVDS